MIEVPERKNVEIVEIEGNNTFSKDKLSHAEELVKNICNSSENALNNDLWLCLEFWIRSGQGKSPENEKKGVIFDDITKVTAPETISRIRRQLKKEGLIAYSDEIEQQRNKKRAEVRRYYKKEKNSIFSDLENRGIF